MKKILIIGASSAIAEATARVWAQRGDELFLIARNKERLAVITKDLKVRGASHVQSFLMDANQFDQHQPVIDRAFEVLGRVDIVLIAHGKLSNQKVCQQSIDLTLQEINTNALSVIALLTYLANRLEKQSTGTIAVISSVAGDRGRASNYVYGSAKAMVTSFTSGLRQRLFVSKVKVVTIKPGFIDTPMTAEFKKGLLWASPSSIANLIVHACDNKNGNVYVPRFWWVIMFTIKKIPEFIFKRLSL